MTDVPRYVRVNRSLATTIPRGTATVVVGELVTTGRVVVGDVVTTGRVVVGDVVTTGRVVVGDVVTIGRVVVGDVVTTGRVVVGDVVTIGRVVVGDVVTTGRVVVGGEAIAGRRVVVGGEVTAGRRVVVGGEVTAGRRVVVGGEVTAGRRVVVGGEVAIGRVVVGAMAFEHASLWDRSPTICPAMTSLTPRHAAGTVDVVPRGLDCGGEAESSRGVMQLAAPLQRPGTTAVDGTRALLSLAEPDNRNEEPTTTSLTPLSVPVPLLRLEDVMKSENLTVNEPGPNFVASIEKKKFPVLFPA